MYPYLGTWTLREMGFGALWGPAYRALFESGSKLLINSLLGCSGDLVSRLSNGPCRASYGLLLGLEGDTKWTYKVN